MRAFLPLGLMLPGGALFLLLHPWLRELLEPGPAILAGMTLIMLGAIGAFLVLQYTKLGREIVDEWKGV